MGRRDGRTRIQVNPNYSLSGEGRVLFWSSGLWLILYCLDHFRCLDFFFKLPRPFNAINNFSFFLFFFSFSKKEYYNTLIVFVVLLNLFRNKIRKLK